MVHRNNPRTLFLLQYLVLYHLKDVTIVVVGEHSFDLYMGLFGFSNMAVILGLLVIRLKLVVVFNDYGVDALDQHEPMRRIEVVKNDEL